MMKILIADDEAAIRGSIKLILSDQPYEIIDCSELDLIHPTIAKDQPDLILLDVHFKNRTSLDLMRQLAAEGEQIPIIVLSGAASAGEAAQAVKLGAYDFIEKPVSADRLRICIERCLENASLVQKFKSMTAPKGGGLEIIGKSQETENLRRMITKFADKDVRVLITGETGTGKEIVAQNIWQRSLRRTRPLIVVNSAALPENLIESELFGHRKGSFTGAVSDQMGKIEMADRGTLFLDEIGDLSSAAQTKLLRFLESGEIQKLGSNQIKTVDVRLIAATSRDLEKEMEKGNFRSDLFYRLNVVRISLAPLRNRREDISLLFNEFVNFFCQKFKEPRKIISPDVAEILVSHSWPGNVRELRNLAERAVLNADQRILKEHLQNIMGLSPRQAKAFANTPPQELEASLSLKEFKRGAEKQYIEKILNKTSGSVSKAAQLLQIDRTYLHQKMLNHGIDHRKFRIK